MLTDTSSPLHVSVLYPYEPLKIESACLRLQDYKVTANAIDCILNCGVLHAHKAVITKKNC